eukprot:UN07133
MALPSKQPDIHRSNSVNLTRGLGEKQRFEKQKEMKRLSILQSIFSGHNEKICENTDRKSIISLPERSERNSLKFSNRINIDIVRDSIDFDLGCDISEIVTPLTQDFIPIPTSFNNVNIKEAARHIFDKFIADYSPYCINISHEN